MKATQDQLETLRNLAASCEAQGLSDASQAGFISYSKARTGQATQEEVNARIHGLRQQIAWASGSEVANKIA